MENGWCTIESDPAVFTEMISAFGVQGVAVEELVSLDDDSLASLSDPVYGLVLLFKWKPSKEKRATVDATSVYFARQVVSNACATQAIINILFNHPSEISLGGELTQLLDFTSALDHQTRGEMIGQSDKIRTVHNSFARSNVFSFEDKHQKEDPDVYHFVAFIFRDGHVWELDGLQEGPIHIGEATPANWKSVAAQGIQQRIQVISQEDKSGHGQGISFSLMAVTRDRIPILEVEIATAKQQNKETAHLEAALQELKEQREKGALENRRRRHNYIPCVVALFRALATKGKLRQIIDEAKQRAQAKAAAKKQTSK